MKELDDMARFMHLAVDYAKKIGFSGQFLIEPKPKEPTKHQYDSDAAACINYLRAYVLLDHFKLNLETGQCDGSPATDEARIGLRGPSRRVGSIDANKGDMLLVWAPTSSHKLLLDCRGHVDPVEIRRLESGGSQLRREGSPRELRAGRSVPPHIGGMDAFARGLKIAAAIRADGALGAFVKQPLSKLGQRHRRGN